MKRGRHWIVLQLLTVAVVTTTAAGRQVAPAGETWHLVDQHWYTIHMGGQKAGWLMQTVESDGSRYRTGSESHLTIGRGPAVIDVEIRSSFVETHSGEPVMMRLVQKMAMEPVDAEWRFTPDHVVHTWRQGGRETIEERPLPATPWLTPMAVRRYWVNRRDAGAQEITYNTLDPQSGLKTVSFTHESLGSETIELAGERLEVTIWKTTTNILPMAIIQKYADRGHLVYEEVRMPALGTTITRLATKDEALAPGEAPELLIKTFVTPSRPIRRPQAARKATLRLRAGEGALPQLPTAGAQRVERGDDGTSTLYIDIDRNQDASDEESGDQAYLASSAMIGAADEAVLALVVKALSGAGDDPGDRAEAMRAFVHTYVSEKGLDTAFATASETAKTRAGDCSEHAVLLCAMLRADQIPARVAIGLIYAESFLQRRDIFGWHMWTQGLIDGRWVDLDATLPRRYHAGHVLTATASFSDGGLGAELASMLQLIGNLEIDVVEVEY